MRLIYTEQAERSLIEFLGKEVPTEKRIEIRDQILSKAAKLVKTPRLGQKEEYLDHLGLSHRRIISGNYSFTE